MKPTIGHGSKFGRKKEEAIAALLAHRNLDDAARAAGIAPTTLARWMKMADFQEAYEQARRQAFGQSIARLQQASGAAVTALLKIIIDPNAPLSIKSRTAFYILSLAKPEPGPQRIEIEDKRGSSVKQMSDAELRQAMLDTLLGQGQSPEQAEKLLRQLLSEDEIDQAIQ